MGERSRNRRMKPLVVDSYAQTDSTAFSQQVPEPQAPQQQEQQNQEPPRSGPREIIDVDVTQEEYIPRKTPAAAYVRLSVENGGHGDEGTLQTQIDLVHEYIRRQDELELYDTYVDNGISGQTFTRPEFERMMEDVRRGRVQCIVVKDLSRFGRDYLETGTYVEKIFPLLGVRLISVNDNFDSTRPGDVNGLAFPMKNLINEMYAKDIGKKIRAYFDTQDKQGKLLGNRSPYGYLMLKDGDDRSLIPDEETAGYVRVIFHWYLSGVPVEQIAKRMDLAGIPTPDQRKAQLGRSGKSKVSEKWRSTSLREILTNQTYTGDTVNRRYVRGSLQPRENWHVIPDTHEALITHEDFDRAWEIFELSRQVVKTKQERRSFLFASRLYCGACGTVLSGDRDIYKDGTEVVVYFCHEKSCIVAQSRVHEDVIKILIMDQLRILIKAACDYRELAKKLLSEDPTKGKAGSIKVRLTNERAGLKQIEERITKAYEEYAEGAIDKAAYAALKKKLGAERKKTERVIGTLEREEQELKDKAGKYLKITEGFEEYLDREGYSQDIVDRLVERIDYFPDGSLKLTLKCADVYEEMLKLFESEEDPRGAGEDNGYADGN